MSKDLIQKYKDCTNTYLNNSGQEITQIVLLMMLTMIFVQAVGFFYPILGFILGILTLTMPQGLVRGSLKIINQQELEVFDDTVYGISGIGRYFTTYFIYSLFTALILFVITVIFMPLVTYSSVGFIGNKDVVAIFTQYWAIIIILLIIVIGTYIFIECNYGMYPYLMETKGIKNLAVLRASRQFMKHKKKAYLKLYLSFWKEYILLIVITMLLSFVLPTMVGISVIVYIIGEAILIKRKMIIYKALFFKDGAFNSN